MMALAILARGWLGFMFLYSAALKFVYYRGAGHLVRRYSILPRDFDLIVGFLLPWGELAVAASFLFGWLFPFGPILGAMLGISFAYAAYTVLKRAKEVPCGCTGKNGDQVDGTTLVRGLTIAVSSILLLIAGNENYMMLPSPVIIIGSIFALFPTLFALRRQLRLTVIDRQREQRRQKMLEQLTAILVNSPAPLPEPAFEVKRLTSS